VEASTSWNTQGLSRPVMELLYLYMLLVGKQLQDNLEIDGKRIFSPKNSEFLVGQPLGVKTGNLRV